MSNSATLVLLLLLALINTIACVDYCNVERKFCMGTFTNLVCRRNNDCSPKANCKEVTIHKDVKDFILNRINDVRNKAALAKLPPSKKGADMLAMSWDDELAYIAQCGVNVCEERLEKACPVSSKYQSAHIMYTNRLDVLFDDDFDYFNETLETWISQGNGMSSLTDNAGPKNNYATLIVAQSPVMGCGWSRVIDAVNYHGYWGHFYYAACVFAQMPIGDVFVEGEPCSKCPKGASCNGQYKALCGSIKYADPGSKESDTFYDYRAGCCRGCLSLLLIFAVTVVRIVLN